MTSAVGFTSAVEADSEKIVEVSPGQVSEYGYTYTI